MLPKCNWRAAFHILSLCHQINGDMEVIDQDDNTTNNDNNNNNDMPNSRRNYRAMRQRERHWKGWHHKPTRSGRVMSGLVIVGVGAALLARQVGVELPAWLFSWEMLLIVVGLYIGAKHGFTRGGWLVPIVLGCIFLADDVYPGVTLTPFFWPVFIIFIGIMVMLKPHRQHHWHNWHRHAHDHNDPSRAFFNEQNSVSGEDTIDSVSIFGVVKKNIISKDFKGGDVVCVFGGAEINFMQADIKGRVELEITQVMGGTKLIIPPHWSVQPEMVAILGGIEDKRPLPENGTESEEKVLVIRGTSVFGGIDIKSY